MICGKVVSDCKPVAWSVGSTDLSAGASWVSSRPAEGTSSGHCGVPSQGPPEYPLRMPWEGSISYTDLTSRRLFPKAPGDLFAGPSVVANAGALLGNGEAF